MNLVKIYELQTRLDQRIIKEHHLEEKNLIDNTILALLVELGELANTTRCFKLWSNKGAMADNIVLDEIADCVHFFVSLAIQLHITPKQLGTVQNVYLDSNLSNGFTQLYSRLSQLSIRSLKGKQMEVITSYHHFMSMMQECLGFSEEDIEAAYYIKNSINHERQNENY